MGKKVTLFLIDLASGKSFEKDCILSFLPQKEITIVLQKSKRSIDFEVGRIYLDPALDKWKIHLVRASVSNVSEFLLRNGWIETD
jgi:hypothetical protein